MDDFGVLVQNYGIKPQGKSAPMASSKTSSKTNNYSSVNLDPSLGTKPFSSSTHNDSSGSGSILDDQNDNIFGFSSSNRGNKYASTDVFGDVFQLPTNITSSSSGGGGFGFDVESMFEGSMNLNKNSNSSNVNDELIWGLSGKKSSNVMVETDDLLSSDPADDFLGKLGKLGSDKKESKFMNENRGNKVTTDDLIPGFGRSNRSSQGKVGERNGLKDVRCCHKGPCCKRQGRGKGNSHSSSPSGKWQNSIVPYYCPFTFDSMSLTLLLLCQDPKHPKKPTIGLPRKRGRETNPFAEEQREKKKIAAVEDDQPSPEEGIFQKDATTEAALVAAGKVIRPPSSKEVPVGGDRHFMALTQKERNRRLHGAFRTIYSPSDEEYIMGGDGDEVFNDLHNAWLDMSIRMHAASKYMLQNKGKCPTPADLEKAKEDLAQERVEHATTKQTVFSLEGQLEAARADLATANASITDLEGKLADAISQRDCVNRAKNKALEDLSKAKKSLKKAQKAKDKALDEMKNEEEAIVNRWLQSEAGEKYKSDLRLNGAAEGAGILIADTLGRARKVMEELHPGEWDSFESRYQALELEEEAPEGEARGEDAPETNILSSSSSEGGDFRGVAGQSGGQPQQQQQQQQQPQQQQQQQQQPQQQQPTDTDQLLEELNICID